MISCAIGALTGFIASTIMGDSEGGFIKYAILGIIGGFIGNWVFGLLGIASYRFIGRLISGVVGTCLLIFIGRLLGGKK